MKKQTYNLINLKHKRLMTSCCVLLFLCACLSLFAATSDNTFFQSSQTFFAEQDIEIPFQTNLKEKHASWAITYLTNTVVAGNAPINSKGRGIIKTKFPKLNQGVVAKTLLTVRLKKQEYSKTLYFFAPPVSRKLNDKISVALWAEKNKSDYMAFFNAYGIKCEQLDQLDSISTDTVIISGMNFNNHVNLLTRISQWGKSRKCRIILLPPFVGKISLSPELSNQMFFAKQDHVHSFNKTYDSLLWNNQPFVKQSFALASKDGITALEFNNNPDGFSFCKFRMNQATVTFCSWQAVSCMDTSPSARNILKSLIIKK